MDIQRLEHMGRELDQRIRGIDEFLVELREARRSLDGLRHSLEWQAILGVKQLQEEINELRGHLERFGVPRLDIYERKLQTIRQRLEDDRWPLAIDPDLIIQSPEQEQERAENILQLIVSEDLTNLKFLDFGCGNGYVTRAAHQKNTKLAVGYDLRPSWQFNNQDRLLFTENFAKVQEQAPYDAILLFDVLDHAVGHPVEILTKISKLVSRQGRVYIRNHPWCSRNGTHLYHHLNKAFVHLILDEVELTRIGGYIGMKTTHITQPLPTYRKWFKDSCFNIIEEVPILDERVDEFFFAIENAVLMEKISQHWPHLDPLEPMRTQYVDYILEPLHLNQPLF